MLVLAKSREVFLPFLILATAVFHTTSAVAVDKLAIRNESHPEPFGIVGIAPKTTDPTTLGEALEQVTEEVPLAITIPNKNETEKEATELEDASTASLSLHDRIDGFLEDIFGIDIQLSAILSMVNAFAYIHLLHITSRSRSYIMELVQLVAFACFPTLPLLQLMNNLFKTIVDRAMGTAGDLKYSVCSMGGQYVFREMDTLTLTEPRKRLVEVPGRELEARPISRQSFLWLARLVLITFTMLLSYASLHIYIERPVRSDWETAPIGPDQRVGWTALGGSIAATLALLVHLCSIRYTIKPAFAPDESVSLLWESEVFTEIVLAALLQDLVVACSGGISLLGFVSVFMANRIVLIFVFIAIIAFNRSVRLFAGSLLGPRKRLSALKPLAVVGSLAICACIVLFQVLTALIENRATSKLRYMASE